MASIVYKIFGQPTRKRVKLYRGQNILINHLKVTFCFMTGIKNYDLKYFPAAAYKYFYLYKG